ncbi:MAG: fibronectin type III domain-containing protein [Treponema sp.]|nr:fibronectin type III domain-containing protein [Treponema sp.]
MKRFPFFAAAVVCAALCAGVALAGCANPNAADTTPPAEASGVEAQAGNCQMALSWTDPADGDFDGVEITFSPESIGAAQPVRVNKGVQSAAVTKLENGTLYQFTLKTVDRAGNKSKGVTISEMPVVWQLALSQTGAYDFNMTDGTYYSHGYTAAPLEVTVTNTSTKASGALQVGLSGADAGSFTLSRSSISGLAAEGAESSAAFTVQPNAGLTAAKTYGATVTVAGGSMSAAFEISFTITQSDYRIALSQTGAHDFSASGRYYSSGYTAPDAFQVTVTNSGNQPTGALEVALTGSDQGSFTLSTSSMNSLAVSGSGTFTVQPNAGLTTAKTYSAAVSVTGKNGISAEFEVTFTVTQSEYRIALSKSGAHDFSASGPHYSSGYTAPDALTVIVTNSGNQPTGALEVALTGSDQGSFTLSTSSMNSLAVSGSGTFTVQPNAALTTEKTYTATVSVTGGNGISAAFDVSFSVLIPIPGVPTGLQAEAQNAGSVALSWNVVDGAASYQVYRLSAGGSYSVIGTSESASYTDGSGLSASTTYYYKVSAVNASGEGTLSAYASALTFPGVPTGFSAEAQSATSVALSWDPVMGAASYNVYRAASAGGDYSRIGSSTSPNTSYTDSSGLSSGTTYYYKVSAVNDTGEGSQSDYAAALTIPGVPTGLSAEAQIAGSIALSWEAVTGAASYRVYRAASAEGDYSPVGTSTGTLYSDESGLSANTTYYYKVSAVNASGEGVQSAYASALTFPGVPTGLSANVPSSNSVMLAWNEVTGAAFYNVYRAANAEGPYNSIGTSADASYTDTGLAAEVLYYYKVSTVIDTREGAQSEPIPAYTFTTPAQYRSMASISAMTVTAAANSAVFLSGLTVSLSAYQIAAYETTYDLWNEVKTWASSNGYTFYSNEGGEGAGDYPDYYQDWTPKALEPVVFVSWRNSVVWCNAYSEMSGKTPVYYSDSEYGTVIKALSDDTVYMKAGANGYRLPTEAEWEAAARGGDPSDTVNWTYTCAGSNNLSDVVNHDSEVGLKAANKAGLYDMSGHVWEYCYDYCSGSYWSGLIPGPEEDPTGPSSGSERVVRGGDNDYYDYNPESFPTVTIRWSRASSDSHSSIGFRVACWP